MSDLGKIPSIHELAARFYIQLWPFHSTRNTDVTIAAKCYRAAQEFASVAKQIESGVSPDKVLAMHLQEHAERDAAAVEAEAKRMDTVRATPPASVLLA